MSTEALNHRGIILFGSDTDVLGIGIAIGIGIDIKKYQVSDPHIIEIPAPPLD